MAHPHNHLRDHKVQRARVSDITKACGGAMSTGGLISAQEKMIPSRAVKKAAMRASGGAVKARADRPARAWGGRTGKKGKAGGKHTVNVIVAPHPPAAAGGMMPPMPAKPPMVPGVAAGPPPGAPPPMPPHPMAPPMAGAPGPGGPMVPGAPPMPPGVPPPGMHYAGGRAHRKKGGAVFSGGQHEAAFTTKGKPKASGNDLDSQTAGVGKGRTPIERSFPSNKQDTPNIGRGAPVTRATGGPIYSDKGKMGPKFIGGGMGGIAKLQKMERLTKTGYGRATVSAQNPTRNPKG